MFKPTRIKRTIFFIFFDFLIFLGTLFLSYNLRFNFDIPSNFLEKFLIVFLYISLLKIIFFSFFKIYSVSWRFFSLSEAKKLMYAHIVAYGFFVLSYYTFPEIFAPISRSILIIDLFLSLIFIGLFRVSKRLIMEGSNDRNLKKTLLVGASVFAQTLFKQNNNFYISAIVDDDETLVDSYFSNFKVHKFDDIELIVKNESIRSVVITKELDQKLLKSLYMRLNKLGIYDIKLAILSDKETILKSLTVEDLLARRPQDLDKEKIEEFIKEKTILITGAGGSIGSMLCHQCEKYGAKKLIMLDNSEYSLYKISEEIKNIETSLIMQSVTNIDLLEETFKLYKPQIVIHAAAYKHVPLVEANIFEGIFNNIIGTKNVIDTSIKYGVEKFVMISTDKAVRPTNVMGATKRICELYAQNVISDNTDIVAVRFGNVLGSSGSVIPKFKSQIEKGKNITVTHPDITRYFMLIAEACELVLQAGAIGRGGELFILDMGEPVKIVDLATKMIELSGRDDIDIEFIGLRPGEKLYEELLIDDSDSKTDYESITVANRTLYDIDKLNKDIGELLVDKNKLNKLKEIVPEFNHQTNT